MTDPHNNNNNNNNNNNDASKGDGSQQEIDTIAQVLSGLQINKTESKENVDEKIIYDQERFAKYRDICVKGIVAVLNKEERAQRKKFGVESGMHLFAQLVFGYIIQVIKGALPKTDLQIKKLNGIHLKKPNTPGQYSTRFGIGFDMRDYPLRPTTAELQHELVKLVRGTAMNLANHIVYSFPEHDFGHVSVLWIDYLQMEINPPYVHFSITAERHCGTCIWLRKLAFELSSDNPARLLTSHTGSNAQDRATPDKKEVEEDPDPMEIDHEEETR